MPKTSNDLRLAIDEEVGNLKRIIDSKEKDIDSYKKEHGVLSTFFREVKAHIDTIPTSPMLYKPPKHQSLVSSPVSAVIHITDGHLGAVQLPDEIEGLGEFNPQICRDRSINFITQSIEWINLHRHAYLIDECVVIVTGDLISGDIHDELRITNAFPAPVQTVEAGCLLADQIALLSTHYKSVRVEFIVEDNHSRLTKKPQCKEAGYNSFNFVVGFIAKEKLASHKNITFNIYPMYEKTINVNGARYLITHGHGIKSWMSIPYYSLERKIAAESTIRMNGPDGNKFDKMVLGHFHHPSTNPKFWMGGSVSGTDAFDHKCGRHSAPSQSAWLVHKKWKEFDRTDFNLG